MIHFFIYYNNRVYKEIRSVASVFIFLLFYIRILEIKIKEGMKDKACMDL